MCLTGCNTPPSPSSGSGASTPACDPKTQSCPCCAALSIGELTYSGNNVVEKDTLGNFPSPEWKSGRAQADQSPVSYARNKKISVSAKFNVTTAACQGGEGVEIKGSATFGAVTMEWTGSTSVSPGTSDVSVSMTSNNALPNEVAIFESVDITWQANVCGQGWKAAGKSRNVTYVTLANPSGTPNYWTLLDISCRGAAGETTEAGVIKNAFNPLKGRAIDRKRDGKGLTYWNPQATCTSTNTAQLLAAANGAGQCGSWAEFLVDMYKVHGITSADKVLVVRTQAAWSASSEGFLVKNWDFDHPPASAASAYTHWVPSQCRTAAHLPGQRNSTPPPAFYNHFIVRADGKFWDPSYGAGPVADQKTWESAAIDGLFRDAAAAAPAGTSIQTGYDKSLNAGTKILEFWELTGNTKI